MVKDIIYTLYMYNSGQFYVDCCAAVSSAFVSVFLSLALIAV